jgi:nicotinamidase-related amidase
MNSHSHAQTDARHTAIIVVDIQEDYTGMTAQPPFPYEGSETLISSINTVLETAAAHGCTIVYTTQEFEGLLGMIVSRLLFKGVAIKGHPGTQLDARLNVVSDYHISKSTLNAFANPRLHAVLQEHHVTELYFVGLDAAYCLDKTAKGGVRLGYHVTLLEDCVVTHCEEKWHRLRQKYGEHGITLMSRQQFLASLGTVAR